MEEDIRSKYRNCDDYSTILKVDEFGFVIGSGDCVEDKFSRIYKSEWEEILDSNSRNLNNLKEKIQNRQLLQRGIPPNLRKRIWKLLLIKNSDSIQVKPYRKDYKEAASNLFYKKIIPQKSNYEKSDKDLKNSFDILKAKSSEYEYQIHVDIQRTFRKHYLFYNPFGKGQLELFNLLVAFANAYDEVGYCQGMSDIAAIFLIHFSEAEAFEMMVTFFKVNELEKIFDKNFTKLPQLLKTQNEFLAILTPEIHSHLSKNITAVQMSFVSWYLTLFSRFPIKLTLCVWDYMMFYGYKVILYFVCAIFYVNRKEIFGLTGESLVLYISKLQEKQIDENEVVDMVALFMKKFQIKKLN